MIEVDLGPPVHLSWPHKIALAATAIAIVATWIFVSVIVIQLMVGD